MDTKGHPNVSWDDVRLVITTGGTLSPGTASTIKYSGYTKDDTGLRRNLTLENETLTGAYDPLAYGVYFRASEGVYTTNDEFSIIMSGMAEDVASVKSRRISMTITFTNIYKENILDGLKKIISTEFSNKMLIYVMMFHC